MDFLTGNEQIARLQFRFKDTCDLVLCSDFGALPTAARYDLLSRGVSTDEVYVTTCGDDVLINLSAIPDPASFEVAVLSSSYARLGYRHLFAGRVAQSVTALYLSLGSAEGVQAEAQKLDIACASDMQPAEYQQLIIEQLLPHLATRAPEHVAEVYFELRRWLRQNGYVYIPTLDDQALSNLLHAAQNQSLNHPIVSTLADLFAHESFVVESPQKANLLEALQHAAPALMSRCTPDFTEHADGTTSLALQYADHTLLSLSSIDGRRIRAVVTPASPYDKETARLLQGVLGWARATGRQLVGGEESNSPVNRDRFTEHVIASMLAVKDSCMIDPSPSHFLGLLDDDNFAAYEKQGIAAVSLPLESLKRAYWGESVNSPVSFDTTLARINNLAIAASALVVRTAPETVRLENPREDSRSMVRIARAVSHLLDLPADSASTWHSALQVVNDSLAPEPHPIAGRATTGAHDAPILHSLKSTVSEFASKIHLAGTPKQFFQFAGARSLSANHLALRAAMQFENDGHDAESIRKKTFWFRGEDGQWRYEISDHSSRVIESRLHSMPNGIAQFSGRLGELLDHPQLYAAYPFMAQVPVVSSVSPTLPGYAEFTEPGISDDFMTLSRGHIEVVAPDLDTWRDLVLHEIQHLIQTVEGFAIGSTSGYLDHAAWTALQDRSAVLKQRIEALPSVSESELGELDQRNRRYLKRELESIVFVQRTLNELPPAAHFKVFNEAYLDLAGEREARVTARDRDLSDQERLLRSPVLSDSNRPIVYWRDMDAKTLGAHLFSRPRADITFLPQESIIRLSTAADRSSFFHEAAHLFLEMEARSAQGRTPTDLQQRLLDWLDAPSFEALTRRQHELFATSFEAYLKDGQLPVSGSSPFAIAVKSIFDTVKTWLSQLYQSGGRQLPDLSSEARDVFNELLAVSDSPDAALVAQADAQAEALARSLLQSGFYSPEDALISARVVSTYALATAERDPDLPTVDSVFDRMNIRVDVVDEITPLDDLQFNFERFDIQTLTATCAMSPSASQSQKSGMDQLRWEDLALQLGFAEERRPELQGAYR